MIEVKSLSHASAYSTLMLYFTGGLSAFALPSGNHALGPIRVNDEIRFYEFGTKEQLMCVAAEAGAVPVGVNETFHMSSAPVTLWRQISNLSKQELKCAADIWGGISYGSHSNNDEDYQMFARHISVSMQAVGIRLRDVAILHHEQLLMALEQKTPVGNGIKNIPMLDLYLAFHSLATELCSARDHLAKLAAIHIRAKDSVDNMPRLEDWLSKSANKVYSSEPLVQLMMEAWGTSESPGFLRSLGELRNKMIHRQPMSANPESAMLRTRETVTEFGPIITIRLAPSLAKSPDMDAAPDPFETFLKLSQQMEVLATKAAQLSRYEPEIISFYAGSQPGLSQ